MNIESSANGDFSPSVSRSRVALPKLGLDELLGALRAAAEPTRLRLLALLVEDELTVTELTTILGQSQPRVSRHLRLLGEAGLADRVREGNWAFYRVPMDGGAAELARRLVRLLSDDSGDIARDRERLGEIKAARAAAAAAYFRENAAKWHEIRSLHVDDSEVEKALVDLVARYEIDELLDIGTGTGRMLALFGARVGRGWGIDLSREMLAIARANLEEAHLGNCFVRHADMYRIPSSDACYDAVIIHQVLHFADRPAEAIAESARVLRPGGHLVVVDFAPHDLARLHDDHAHRRLGFSDEEIVAWQRAAGLASETVTRLPGDPLTVMLWSARRAPGLGHTDSGGEARQ